MIDRLSKNVEAFAIAHERLLTGLLLAIAAGLILVALFGKSHHKAMCLVYIVL